VSITNPSAGELFIGPQQVTITAAASDPDGSISQVAFFVDGISIGTDNSAPYTANFDLLSEGFYLLEAEATDNMGATILSARVIFKSSNGEGNTPSSTRIYGQADPNPQTFVEQKFNISNRPPTTNFVDWTLNAWLIDIDYPSPDLTTIVEELVNQPGWRNGNAMAFIFDATGSERRKAYAYEESQAEGPQLEITYLGGGIAARSSGQATTISTAPEVAPFKGEARIYPNPTDYQFFIELDSPVEKEVTINLYDAAGRLVRTQEHALVKGFNKINFLTGNGQGGVHYIHLKNEEISILKKVILLNR